MGYLWRLSHLTSSKEIVKFLFLHCYVASCVQKDDKGKKPQLLVINFDCQVLQWPGSITVKWGKSTKSGTTHMKLHCWSPPLFVCRSLLGFVRCCCACLKLVLMDGRKNSWCGEKNCRQDTTDSPTLLFGCQWQSCLSKDWDGVWFVIAAETCIDLASFFSLDISFFLLFLLSWLVFWICKA